MQYFRLKFQKNWNIVKFYTIYFTKKKFFSKKIFGTCSKKCQIFHCIYCTKATRFNGKQFSHVFSSEHVFSKDETKNSRIACLLGTAVFLLCNRKISYVFSSCFSAALSFARRKKKKRKEKEKNALHGKERESRVLSMFYPLVRGNATFRNGGKGFYFKLDRFFVVYSCAC